jgi:hypothetical protein
MSVRNVVAGAVVSLTVGTLFALGGHAGASTIPPCAAEQAASSFADTPSTVGPVIAHPRHADGSAPRRVICASLHNQVSAGGPTIR